jgi:hypothetical protein
MAKQTINIGLSANDRTGDPLRTAFSKTNNNFTEVYNSISSLETAIENVETPSNISELNNDAGFITAADIPSQTEAEFLEVTNRYSLGDPVSFTKVLGETEFDEIDEGLTLTRDARTPETGGGGLYNSEVESEWDALVSPVGLLWNWDGWDNVDTVKQRQYVNLRQALKNRIGENIVGAELVAYDTTNDKYYTFLFSQWDQGAQHDGNFAYTRTLIDVSDQIGITFADGSNLVTKPKDFSGYPQTYVGDTSAYTLVLEDAGKHVYAFGVTITLPNRTEVDYPIGSVIKIVAENQEVILEAASGVSINSSTSVSLNGSWRIPANSIATLIKTRQGTSTAPDVWRLSVPANNGSADTGDITFVGSTISAPDDATIRMQAKNDDGVVTSQLTLNPDDRIAKLESSMIESQSYFDGGPDYSTAIWTVNQFGDNVLIFNDSRAVYDFLELQGTSWDRGNNKTFSWNGDDQRVEVTGYSWDDANEILTLNVGSDYPPPEDPTAVTSITFDWLLTSRISVDSYDFERIELIGNGIPVRVETDERFRVTSQNTQIRSRRDDTGYIELDAGDYVRIQTNDYSDESGSSGSYEWQFNNDGTLTFPDNTVQSTAFTGTGGTFTATDPNPSDSESTVALDITKSVQKLANGDYTLEDGIEGQIMYLVPQTGADYNNVYLVIANARVATDSTSGAEIRQNNEFLPFINSRANNLSNVITLIFTDGAWNLSGGEWD